MSFLNANDVLTKEQLGEVLFADKIYQKIELKVVQHVTIQAQVLLMIEKMVFQKWLHLVMMGNH